MIKILDCTLRDGGYLNDWKFGKDNISEIITLLSNAKIDYIECGFLKNIKSYNPDVALYNDAGMLNHSDTASFTLMLNYGEEVTNLKFNKNVEIRLAFKPHQLSEIETFTKPLIDNGYAVSLNPMHIGLYSAENLKNLADITNSLAPTCLTPVDTMGILTPDDTEKIFTYLDENVNKTIPFGFHSHNNLNLSRANVEKIIDMDLKRDVIIDTSLNGISRGGGMLPTEEMAEMLNKKCGAKYDIQILEELNALIKKIVPTEENKQPYCLSAKYKCHPNYALYLITQNYPTDKMPEIFKQIPKADRIIYSQKVIENIINK